jgi:hypothetical protein
MLHEGADTMSAILQLDPTPTLALGWLVTLACAVLSLVVALRSLQQSPRMFTAMALFACSWILVLGVYKQTAQENEFAGLMAEVGSFLDVYIGGLLVLEGELEIDRENFVHRVASLQRWALWLLLFIAAAWRSHTEPRLFLNSLCCHRGSSFWPLCQSLR